MALLIYFVMLDCRILPKYIALYLLYNLAKGYNIILLKFISGLADFSRLCLNSMGIYPRAVPLGVTANEVDSDVGEAGEEDEGDELCHKIILNGNSEIFEISEFPEINLAV